MDVWDPIGVKDEPNAQDEYDSYLVRRRVRAAAKWASDENIEDHLWRIVTDRMELSAKKSDMSNTVKALRQIPLPQNSN